MITAPARHRRGEKKCPRGATLNGAENQRNDVHTAPDDKILPVNRFAWPAAGVAFVSISTLKQ